MVLSVIGGDCMKGKVKTLEGILRKYGKEQFLECCRYYSCHVREHCNNTIDEMESRWYDRKQQITEADKMIMDYNNYNTILNAKTW